ncbi:Hsp20/alpha crystallin family protein [Legionella qingyii]|uniref:Hsp20/alpha crystallin family protein n=1 Tax=Legionella qingyii TaxID=2184757 RepID=A0A317TZ48_9GAMM|nr:Hsp20/alpha crystallin family protein [Legionella qingyii]PWY54359.1 Hsp20/alpha crystallin family protein [Legionella qingyii]RUR24098.1 Hsp20/alpha crystallin family protein [Legionella qingyii]RUR24301.1 Hsp20/alpha crystallin family protein [Legionella qingyii]
MASLKKYHQSENVISPFLRLQQEVNHAMNDFYDLFEPMSTDLKKFENIKLSPALDIIEDQEFFKIEAEMPGMSEKDITVTFNDNKLTIEGEKSTSKKDEKKNFVSREITYGRYERTVSLPLTADVDKATASFKKGMLWVTIPKKALGTGNSKSIKIEKAE